MLRRLHPENQRIRFFPDPDNIGVEILLLFSVALISNIGLPTAEALTGEPNEKDLTFNKETLTDNDEVEKILIGYYVFMIKK